MSFNSPNDLRSDSTRDRGISPLDLRRTADAQAERWDRDAVLVWVLPKLTMTTLRNVHIRRNNQLVDGDVCRVLVWLFVYKLERSGAALVMTVDDGGILDVGRTDGSRNIGLWPEITGWRVNDTDLPSPDPRTEDGGCAYELRGTADSSVWLRRAGTFRSAASYSGEDGSELPANVTTPLDTRPLLWESVSVKGTVRVQ